MGWWPLPYGCTHGAESDDLAARRLKQPDLCSALHRLNYVRPENPFVDMTGPGLVASAKVCQPSLVSYGEGNGVELIWMVSHPRSLFLSTSGKRLDFKLGTVARRPITQRLCFRVCHHIAVRLEVGHRIERFTDVKIGPEVGWFDAQCCSQLKNGLLLRAAIPIQQL